MKGFHRADADLVDVAAAVPGSAQPIGELAIGERMIDRIEREAPFTREVESFLIWREVRRVVAGACVERRRQMRRLGPHAAVKPANVEIVVAKALTPPV